MPANNANNAMIMMELKKVSSAYDSAISKARAAKTIREVVNATHVTVPGYLKAITRSLPERRRLESTAEQSAERLVRAQLLDLRALDPEERQKQIGRLKANDWSLLSGNFPRLVGFVDREVAAMRHEQKEQGNDTALRPRLRF